MKHTFYSLLPLFLLLDLVIPFLLAPTYPGYRHTRQVMSVLGNRSAPFHTVYTLWLLFLGTAILLTWRPAVPPPLGPVRRSQSGSGGNLDHLRIWAAAFCQDCFLYQKPRRWRLCPQRFTVSGRCWVFWR